MLHTDDRIMNLSILISKSIKGSDYLCTEIRCPNQHFTLVCGKHKCERRLFEVYMNTLHSDTDKTIILVSCTWHPSALVTLV